MLRDELDTLLAVSIAMLAAAVAWPLSLISDLLE